MKRRLLVLVAVFAMVLPIAPSAFANTNATDVTTVNTPYGPVSMISGCDDVTFDLSGFQFDGTAGADTFGPSGGIYVEGVTHTGLLHGNYVSITMLQSLDGEPFPIDDVDLSALQTNYQPPAECDDGSGTQTVNADLSRRDCASNWHFFILNRIARGESAPSSIQVEFESGETADVSLWRQRGRTAFYFWRDSQPEAVESASANIYGDWSGRFRHFNGRCA